MKFKHCKNQSPQNTLTDNLFPVVADIKELILFLPAFLGGFIHKDGRAMYPQYQIT